MVHAHDPQTPQSIISIVVASGLLGAGALVVVGQSKVPSQAIVSSVTRTPELMERAWRLPVAATFNRQLTWQSNGSDQFFDLMSSH